MIQLMLNHDGAACGVDLTIGQYDLVEPSCATLYTGQRETTFPNLAGNRLLRNSRVHKYLSPSRHEQPGVNADLRGRETQALPLDHEVEHFVDQEQIECKIRPAGPGQNRVVIWDQGQGLVQHCGFLPTITLVSSATIDSGPVLAVSRRRPGKKRLVISRAFSIKSCWCGSNRAPPYMRPKFISLARRRWAGSSLPKS